MLEGKPSSHWQLSGREQQIFLNNFSCFLSILTMLQPLLQRNTLIIEHYPLHALLEECYYLDGELYWISARHNVWCRGQIISLLPQKLQSAFCSVVTCDCTWPFLWSGFSSSFHPDWSDVLIQGESVLYQIHSSTLTSLCF